MTTAVPRLALLCASLALLSACGGGGGDDGTTTIVQPFLVWAEVDGAPFGQALVPGVQITETMESGDRLVLKASPVGMQWIVTVGDTTVAADASSDSAQWSATVRAPKGGSLKIVARSNDGREATLQMAVAPQRYERGDWVAGEARTTRETSTWQDDSTTVRTMRVTTVDLQADGTHTVEQRDVGAGQPGVLIESRTADADDNRVSRRFANGTTCSYTPARQLLSFPLYYGKSWTSDWQYACSAGYREKASAVNTVDDVGSITVPAGTFEALRIRSVISYSESNDNLLVGGAFGQGRYTQEQTCWWATSIRRVVRCENSYSYLGGAPSGYLKSLTQELVGSP